MFKEPKEIKESRRTMSKQIERQSSKEIIDRNSKKEPNRKSGVENYNDLDEKIT